MPFAAKPSFHSHQNRILRHLFGRVIQLCVRADPMPLEKAAQYRGLKIACCGFALALIAIAVSNQIPRSGPSNNGSLSVRTREALFLVPCVVGSVLMFAGFVRIGVTARPGLVLFGGLSLFLAASFLPLLSAPFLSAFATGHSTVPFLLPLFVFRVLGLILFSMGMLRSLSVGRKEI